MHLISREEEAAFAAILHESLQRLHGEEEGGGCAAVSGLTFRGGVRVSGGGGGRPLPIEAFQALFHNFPLNVRNCYTERQIASWAFG